MKNIGTELWKLIKKEKVSAYSISQHFGIARESLYRSLKDDANPEWKRIKQILDYLGYDIKLENRKGVKVRKSKSRGKKKRGESA